MSKYRNFLANAFLSCFVIGLAWGGFKVTSLFLSGPSQEHKELVALQGSIRNQIVDVKGKSQAKETKVKRNIKGVSLDVLEDDTDLVKRLFESYLVHGSQAEYEKHKKDATDYFTDGSDFVKLFFKENSFKKAPVFQSLSLIPHEWKENGSIVYDGVVTYKVEKKTYKRVMMVTIESDANGKRMVKAIQIDPSEFK